MSSKRIDCHKCAYYYVTWDPKMPYGCRAMNFKAPHMPSLVVRRSSGMPCQMFRRKSSPK